MRRYKCLSILTRRYPFYSGCGSIANSRFLSRIGGSGSGLVWCKVPGGEVLADLDDYVGRAAFFMADLDKKISWICRKIVRNGDNVLDIGANIGIVSVHLSTLVGSSGQVHSFEPNPAMIERLSLARQRNGLHNIMVHPIALGARQDRLSLSVPTGNSGEGSLLFHKNRPSVRTVEVEVASLDEIVQRENIGNIRFIKIDVEGFEVEVLRGAERVLEGHEPHAILFEANVSLNSTFWEVPAVRILKEFGYSFLMIPRCMLRMRLISIQAEPRSSVSHDILAVHRKHYSEITQLLNVVG